MATYVILKAYPNEDVSGVNGTTGWEQSDGGTTTIYTEIDAPTISDDSYIVSNLHTSEYQGRLGTAGLSAGMSGKNIHLVEMKVRARRGTGEFSAAANLQGGLHGNNRSSTLSSTSRSYTWSYPTNPTTGVAWTSSDILALDTTDEYYFKPLITGTPPPETHVRVNQLWLYVYTVPPPPLPTLVTPANASTVTSSRPTLGATVTAASQAVRSKVQWQVATDVGFTTNVRTITEADSDLRTSGLTSEVVPVSSALFQGVWYMRARQVDEYGFNSSSWTTTQSFTVAHPPSPANQTPTGGLIQAWPIGASATPGASITPGASATVTFSWDFTDPWDEDEQTAYQIIIERVSDATVLYDTDKVETSDTEATITLGSSARDVPLRWKVRLWDLDDVAGSYSAWQLFSIILPPSVVITNPDEGEEIATAIPEITWSFDSSGNFVQIKARVIVRDHNASDEIVYDSGQLNQSSHVHTLPPLRLETLGSYSVYVTATDENGLENNYTVNFTTEWILPATPTFTVTTTGFDDSGYFTVAWDDTDIDEDFYQWLLYRRIEGEATWELIATFSDVEETYEWQDVSPGSNVEYEYSLVQMAIRFGTEFVLGLGNTVQATAETTHYWLIHPDDPDQMIRLVHARDEQFSEGYEQQSFQVFGRGRHVDVGDRLGYAGTLTVSLRNVAEATARAQRLAIEALKAQDTELLLRNPFGDVWQVTLGTLSFNREAGVGLHEMGDMQIPYEEVV